MCVCVWFVFVFVEKVLASVTMPSCYDGFGSGSGTNSTKIVLSGTTSNSFEFGMDKTFIDKFEKIKFGLIFSYFYFDAGKITLICLVTRLLSLFIYEPYARRTTTDAAN